MKHFMFILMPFHGGPSQLLIGSGVDQKEASTKVALSHHHVHITPVGEVDDLLSLLRPYVIISEHAII